jgi:formiminotetrahydrofolate cyclodeaminase
LSVCAELAMATLRCAAYNVRVNLAGVQSVERFQIDSSVNKQMVDASRTIQRVIPRIWAKVGPS